MKKYQIKEVTPNYAHAGSKAILDVGNIAEKQGFKAVNIVMQNSKPGYLNKFRRQVRFYRDWKKAYKNISKNAVVLLQNPFHYPQIIRNKILTDLKNKKNVKFICLVHDVELLREENPRKYYQKEFKQMLKLADVIIVHNLRMKEFFLEQNVPDSRIIVLKIFDYLTEKNSDKEKINYRKNIIIAGNLDSNKASYLRSLNKINCNFDLYGPNFKMKKYKNIFYHGVVSPDSLTDRITGGFGLVWDGESIDGCTGPFGKYLKYNNPHKLSLYLASGIPVVVWKDSAEASFVEENGIGITVASLTELPEVLNSVTLKDYRALLKNVNNVSRKIRGGMFTSSALMSAVNMIEDFK